MLRSLTSGSVISWHAKVLTGRYLPIEAVRVIDKFLYPINDHLLYGMDGNVRALGQEGVEMLEKF